MMNITDEMVEAALGEFLLVEDRMYDRDDAPSARYVTEVALMAALAAGLAVAPTVDVTCPTCGGRGSKEFHTPKTEPPTWGRYACPACNGTGKHRALILGPEVES